MRLIIITPDNIINGETTIINTLFANGLQRLHIRKPFFTADDYRKYIEEINQQYHKYVVLHACFELFSEYNIGGIHLNTFARKDPGVWQLIRRVHAGGISASFHSWKEIIDNPFPYDYIFISPVFDSISKSGYTGCIDLTGIAETRSKLFNEYVYCPSIIGLGGVGAEQFEILHQHGFDGGAMLGGIWMKDDPLAEFIKTNKIVRSLH